MDRAPAAGRPFVQVNCAVSADGRLAFADGRRARLTGPEDLARVQRLRSESDAILVGVGTVLKADPSLRVHWELLGRSEGPNPLRVVLDSRGRLPDGAKVLDGSSRTLIATSRDCPRRFPPSVEVFAAGSPRVDLVRLLSALEGRGVRRLMVEGGAEVIASFLRASLVDRFTVYVAPILIGGSTAPPLLRGPETVDEAGAIPLRLRAVERLGDGVLLTWEPSPRGRT